MFLSEMLK